MEILTGDQMRAADRYAIETLGIPSLGLMENAGVAVADAMVEDLRDLPRRSATILCGKGNNGGDGLVVLRRLAARGVVARAVLLAEPAALRGDAAANWRRAEELGLETHVAADERAWSALRPSLPRASWWVDAMLGTGVRGAVRGLVASVVADLDGLDVVSVDLPSGLDADSHRPPGPSVVARRTYTLCRPKRALAVDPAAARAGTVRVLPIGIPDEAVAASGATWRWQDRAEVAGLLPARPRDAHKGTFGHLLIVAGAAGKAGAAVLSGRAALRAGAGLVTVGCPASVRGEVAVQQAELVTEPLAEGGGGALAAAAAARIQDLLGPRDALVLGPGLGTEGSTVRAVRSLALAARRPALIDADGLNALAADGGALATLRDAAAPRILTPHPGEAARLLGCTAAEVQADRVEAARNLAERGGAIVVLKGHRTLITRPDGRLAVNPGGNAGMATGGTGDVLSGVVGALLARGLDAWDAARLGVFVHADAGDRAAARLGEDGLIASDVVESLPAALAAVAAETR